MYNNAKELLELTTTHKVKISDIVLQNECKLTEKTSDEVLGRIRNILRVMKDSANSALQKEVRSVSGLTGGNAKKLEAYKAQGSTISGNVVVGAMARALSCSEVNASMGKIVAAPTAGSCGIVPAAVISTAEVLNASDEDMVRALLTASGIGQIIAKNATLSGAEGGCQAECGAASSMAAAALVEMAGGTPQMAFNAASIAIMNILGLVCDPVAGLVELPCANRNAMGVVNAMTCADLALAGIESIIPFDEVVESMYKIGRQMSPALRETAMGGLAVTPTGIKLTEQLYKSKK